MKVEGLHVDITTLRKEGEYNDKRHPSKIEYVKDHELSERISEIQNENEILSGV